MRFLSGEEEREIAREKRRVFVRVLNRIVHAFWLSLVWKDERKEGVKKYLPKAQREREGD